MNLYKKERDGFTELINSEHAFFTMSDVNRLGVNPLSSYNTPHGLYAYPLNEEYFAKIKFGDILNSSKRLPFKADAPYIHIFFTDWTNVLHFSRYNENMYENDIKKLKQHYPDLKLDDVDFSFFEKQSYSTKIWSITYYLKKNSKDWARILYSILGYDAIIDPGYGIIHSSEKTQAVFFPQSKKTNIVHIQTLYNSRFASSVKKTEPDIIYNIADVTLKDEEQYLNIIKKYTPELVIYTYLFFDSPKEPDHRYYKKYFRSLINNNIINRDTSIQLFTKQNIEDTIFLIEKYILYLPSNVSFRDYENYIQPRMIKLFNENLENIKNIFIKDSSFDYFLFQRILRMYKYIPFVIRTLVENILHGLLDTGQYDEIFTLIDRIQSSFVFSGKDLFYNFYKEFLLKGFVNTEKKDLISFLNKINANDELFNFFCNKQIIFEEMLISNIEYIAPKFYKIDNINAYIKNFPNFEYVLEKFINIKVDEIDVTKINSSSEANNLIYYIFLIQKDSKKLENFLNSIIKERYNLWLPFFDILRNDKVIEILSTFNPVLFLEFYLTLKHGHRYIINKVPLYNFFKNFLKEKHISPTIIYNLFNNDEDLHMNFIATGFIICYTLLRYKDEPRLLNFLPLLNEVRNSSKIIEYIMGKKSFLNLVAQLCNENPEYIPLFKQAFTLNNDFNYNIEPLLNKESAILNTLFSYLNKKGYKSTKNMY
jgi:hypothetical protein